MKNYLILKYLISLLKEYIFIFLTATTILIFSSTNSFTEESVFTINNVKVKGPVDLNFSREKYMNEAFISSFEILINKILLTRDLKKINNLQLKDIKKLIGSFQILEESYKKDFYEANFKIFYHEKKVKNFLGKKNISFSRPERITAIFFTVLYINGEIQNSAQNYFHKEWNSIKIKNELINFILPLEDLDDLDQIAKMKHKIEKLDIESLVNKYDVENYVFTLMDYENKNLKIYIRTNFNNNLISKNVSYDLKNIENEFELITILKDLKLKITDLWKEENLVNLLMPLSIKLKFQHKSLNDLQIARSVFGKISIIDNYVLEEFNINNSYFKIYYYGNPKKLKSELLKFGYLLKNDQGFWQIYLNE